MKKLVVAAIRFYQATVSPDHGILRKPYGHCPLYPSCSQYAIDSIEKYGVLRGTVKAAARVARCNPLTRPGIDIA